MITMDKSIVTVNILGSEYKIKGFGEPEYILTLANYINNKMQEIQETLNIKDEKKIAILAAINITDELFELRKNVKEGMVPKEQIQSIRNKIEGMISSIDKELPAALQDEEQTNPPPPDNPDTKPGEQV